MDCIETNTINRVSKKEHFCSLVTLIYIPLQIQSITRLMASKGNCTKPSVIDKRNGEIDVTEYLETESNNNLH